MRVFIVPNEVSAAINAKLDEKLAGIQITAEEREVHYDTLLEFFDQHGTIPEFTFAKKDSYVESGEK